MNALFHVLIVQGLALPSGQVLSPGVQVQADKAQAQAWVDAGLAQWAEAAPDEPAASGPKPSTRKRSAE